MTPRARGLIDRRAVVAGLGAGAGLAALDGPASAQIAGLEVIAAGPPGDGQDQLARAVAEGLALTKLTPRAMAVNVARDVDALNEFVAGKRPRAAMMVLGLSTIGSLQTAKATDALKASRPLARILGEQLPVVVPFESKLKSLADLMAALKQDPGSVTFAGRATSSADFLLCRRLVQTAGGDVAKLSFRTHPTSAEASNRVLRGEVAVGVGAFYEFLQQIRGGTLRPLGLASDERAPGIDAPTLKEQGVDIVELNWRGLITRSAIGQALIDRYGEAIHRVVETPGWKQLMRDRFWLEMYQPAADFSAFIESERQRVAALLGAPR